MNNINQVRTVIELGWYHPSNANWSYHIFMILDDSGARLYRSVFGGDSRIREKFNMESLHAGKGSNVEYKWKDIKDLLDIEDYTGKNYGKGSFDGDK